MLLVCMGATLARAASPANVSFAGAQSFPAEELRRTLAEQLNDIAVSGLTPARADDAAWFLGSFYRKQGFPNAEVTFDIRGSQLVLNVKEGMRTVVHSLTFAGNRSFPDKTLYEYVEPEGITGTRKLSKGSFAIQAHDPKSVARYRNIMVKALPE